MMVVMALLKGNKGIRNLREGFSERMLLLLLEVARRS